MLNAIDIYTIMDFFYRTAIIIVIPCYIMITAVFIRIFFCLNISNISTIHFFVCRCFFNSIFYAIDVCTVVDFFYRQATIIVIPCYIMIIAVFIRIFFCLDIFNTISINVFECCFNFVLYIILINFGICFSDYFAIIIKITSHIMRATVFIRIFISLNISNAIITNVFKCRLDFMFYIIYVFTCICFY